MYPASAAKSPGRTAQALALSVGGLCVAICLVGCAARREGISSHEQDDGQDFADTFERLRESKILLGEEGQLYGELATLERAGARATKAVCAEIDRSGPERRRYVIALYFVLGNVKDPDSIDWLRAKLQTSSSEYVYGAWIGSWIPKTGSWCSQAHRAIRTIQDPDRWLPFLAELYDRAPDSSSRTRVLELLARCFHSAVAIRFFEELADRPGIEPRLLLAVDEYLLEHERTISVGKLQACIAELDRSGDGAATVRHEAMVPWLLRRLQAKPDEDEDEEEYIECALQNVTFQRLKGREAWTQWYEQNKDRRRGEWVASALDEFELMLARDPSSASGVLWDVMWDYPAVAGRVEQWLNVRKLHPAIARWLVTNYHPYWRSKLRPIAERIGRESWTELDWYGKQGLQALEFTDVDGCALSK